MLSPHSSQPHLDLVQILHPVGPVRRKVLLLQFELELQTSNLIIFQRDPVLLGLRVGSWGGGRDACERGEVLRDVQSGEAGEGLYQYKTPY